MHFTEFVAALCILWKNNHHLKAKTISKLKIYSEFLQNHFFSAKIKILSWHLRKCPNLWQDFQTSDRLSKLRAHYHNESVQEIIRFLLEPGVTVKYKITNKFENLINKVTFLKHQSVRYTNSAFQFSSCKILKEG